MICSGSTPTEDVIEKAAGLEFADPYHWLEASDSSAVQQWQETQNQAASDYVKNWPHFDTLQQSVDHYLVGQTELPHFAGDHWFHVEDSRVVMTDSPFGRGTTVFDLQSDRAGTSAFLSWFAPSPNGQLLAVGVCEDGSENNTIRLVNIVTREALPNPPKQILMDNWTGGVSWLPDSSGFYFSAFEGDPATSNQRIFFYCLSDYKVTAQEIPLPDSNALNYTLVTISDTGRYHLVHQGLFVLCPVAMIDMAQAHPAWQPFITDKSSTVIGRVSGDQYYALTYSGAPRGRIVKIPVHTDTPNDPDSWTELVPASDAVMRSMRHAGQHLYIHELVDTYSRVRIVSLTGEIIGTVPLPDKATIAEGHYAIQHLIPKGHPDEFLFSSSTLLQSWGVYRYQHDSKTVETLRAPAVSIDNAVIEDHWATSPDGTRIPYHCVRLTDTDMSVPQPALLYAYGAFNVPWTPAYPGAMAAFIAAGGVYVHGHVRGGGEMGIEWWHGGRMKNKQNGYQDLYSIAGDLIARGCTTPQQLALTGRSNGGLMAGVALTQRPDLWQAVVPQVPIFDLVGALRDPYTRQVIEDEFADPENPEDVTRMVEYSPYHLITEQTRYPSVYIVAGDTDPRCASWHARKFGARLQAAGSGDNPVLIHIWGNAGHGQATARSIAVMQYTEWLAFIMRQLNLIPAPVRNQPGNAA